MSITFPRTEWNEPALELAWAHGATELDPADFGLIVNVLADGGVVVSGETVDEAALREGLAAHAGDGEGVIFRCDARVPYRVAAPWIDLMAAVGVRQVACAVKRAEEGRSMRPSGPQARLEPPSL